MKIAFVVPYFGKFPNYFELWEHSAAYNKDIDFLVFTNSPRENKYANIHYIQMELDEIVNRIRLIVQFKPMLPNPYKIVDYKPMYGCIFKDYLENYSHWGYCDSDVIFGNLSFFITEELLKNYDRIYQHGHMCIYKNTEEVNFRWKTKHNLISYNYIEVFKVRGVKMFDERGGMWDIWKENKWSQYLSEKDFADILPTKSEFTTDWNAAPMTFHYKSGHLYEYSNEKNKREFAYLHLQKRKMTVENIDKDNFYIKPNVFCSDVNKIVPKNNEPVGHRVNHSKRQRVVNIFSRPDEVLFHVRVAWRRIGMYMKGENWHVKYKLY